jgi:hypothetical protein
MRRQLFSQMLKLFLRTLCGERWQIHGFADKLLLDKDGGLRFHPDHVSLRKLVPILWVTDEDVEELHKKFAEITSQ